MSHGEQCPAEEGHITASRNSASRTRAIEFSAASQMTLLMSNQKGNRRNEIC